MQLKWTQFFWRQLLRLRRKAHLLDYFFWEATLRCNLACRHCGSDCLKDPRTSDLSADRVIGVFRNIAERYFPSLVMVAVMGGEPLVRPDLFEILAEVQRFGFPWGLVTNGMLVDEHIVQKCQSTGMKTVSVSIDGTSTFHNAFRGHPESYERAEQAVRLFVASRAFQVVDVITCANAENLDHLENLGHHLHALGVQSWRLFTIFPKGRATTAPHLIASSSILRRTFSLIEQMRNIYPGWAVSYSEEGYLGPAWELKVRDIPHYCGAGINIGGLLADGSYSACPSLSREWIQGHVDELPFMEAWDRRYRNMRSRDWMKNDSCGECAEWKNCQGSSLHLWDWKRHCPAVCHLKLLNEPGSC
ncbi:MAG TPA: radical SAM protein [Candidatus Ozemobacteraceae bacterium]|nr:radical SAM protein [Candidatus Ozemobacteraceae bacterium]